MRSRTLHSALAAFANEAASYLAAEHASGAELPFDVVEVAGRRGRAATLYCYRTLTAEFIGQRHDQLRRMATFGPAVHALVAIEGLDRYLRSRGHGRVAPDRRLRAEAALASFLADLFRDATDFELSPERLERAYELLETAVFAGQRHTLAVAVLRGLAIESPELALGEGLSLVRAEALADPPPTAIGLTVAEEGSPVLAVLSLPAAPGDPDAYAGAVERLVLLQRALRLFSDTWVGVDPVGWLRIDDAPWQPLAVPGTGRSRGTLAVLPAGEDELRAFCNLIARRTPRTGELAWALGRFEMGCDRPLLVDALTDHLLALRALLEPEGPASGRLAGRVAALCAVPQERADLAERLRYAIELERAAVLGARVAEEDAVELACELAGHLRALLRDVLCGHLDSDLRHLADSLILDAEDDFGDVAPVPPDAPSDVETLVGPECEPLPGVPADTADGEETLDERLDPPPAGVDDELVPVGLA